MAVVSLGRLGRAAWSSFGETCRRRVDYQDARLGAIDAKATGDGRSRRRKDAAAGPANLASTAAPA